MLSLLRLEYLPAVLLPAIFGLYLSNSLLINNFETILGWSLLAISQNVLNDIFDKEKKINYDRKTLFLISFLLSISGLYFFKTHEMLLRSVSFF